MADSVTTDCNVPTPLRDGVIMCTDVYRPAGSINGPNGNITIDSITFPVCDPCLYQMALNHPTP